MKVYFKYSLGVRVVNFEYATSLRPSFILYCNYTVNYTTSELIDILLVY